ncbi:YchJ family protein [Nannocystaceae bacterium ST9]
MPSVSVNAPCPCGSGHKYKRCCRPLHAGAPASSPEALMRSRYCAYALGEVDYLLATTHPEGPHFRSDTREWRADVAQFCTSTRFEGLEIQLSREQGDRGEVRFFARLSREGRDVSFVEHSVFVREGGRWLYLSGEGE